MRKGIWFILILIVVINNALIADHVNFSTGNKAAENKLIQLGRSDEYSIFSSNEILGKDDQTMLFYVFELQPEGYIITTADNDLPPVIAYSFTSSFYDEKSGNVLLDLITTDINLRLQNIPNLPQQEISNRKNEWQKLLAGNNVESRFDQWPPEGTTPTGGWLLENWTQNAPYNNFCPMDNITGNRSIAGCPAIAMAQILNYLQTVNSVYFDDEDDYFHNYAGRQYWIDDDHEQYDFLSFPQMNVNLDTLSSHYLYEEPITNADKASLVFACGVAAQQVYTSQISGTFGVNQAYQAFQKFNFGDAQLIDETTPDFYDHIAQNMMDAFPVHFASVTPAGDAGHNFVIDGYNTDDYYHINFGWGGTYNGWYLLPDEIPYGLTVVEGTVVDIFPEEAYTLYPPQNVQVEDWSATVSWEAPMPSVNVLTGYNIYLDGALEAMLDVDEFEYIFAALIPDQVYVAGVSAVYDEGESDIVEFEFTYTYGPYFGHPHDLVVDHGYSFPDNIYDLSWEEPYANMRVLANYNIYVNDEIFETVAANVLEYTIINAPLNVNNEIVFYITALYENPNGESIPSNSVTCIPMTSAENELVFINNLSNYPNPFNPETTINFSIEEGTTGILSIYNVRGQLVELQKFNSGDHEFVWNADKLSSGVYLYKLKTDDNTITKKMLLLK